MRLEGGRGIRDFSWSETCEQTGIFFFLCLLSPWDRVQTQNDEIRDRIQLGGSLVNGKVLSLGLSFLATLTQRTTHKLY